MSRQWHKELMALAKDSEGGFLLDPNALRDVANEALAEVATLRAMVGELVDVVASQREKLIDHTNLYDPRFDGDEPDAHVVNLIARAREATQ